MTDDTSPVRHQRACLFAAGTWAGEELPGTFDDAYLIAVDGGAHYLRTLGLLPHLMVGDLDSVDPALTDELRESGTEIQRFPVDKDATDFELAVQVALARGYDRLDIYGALGGDLDHELGNLNVCARSSQGSVRITLVGRNGKGCLIGSGQSRFLKGPKGSRFSIIPIGGPLRSLVIDDARWNGTFETVPFGSTMTLRNELVGSPASISIGAGTALLWQPSIAP